MRKLILIFMLFMSSLAFAVTNLNTASETELESLPGIGPKLATEIIAGRPYQSVDDLKKVKGIGAAKFEKLKGLVDVGAATESPKSAATTPAPASVPPPSVTPTLPSSGSSVAPAHASGSGKNLAPNEVININTADAATLEKLPGIGEKKAELIIQGRPYNTPEDIMKVKGIKLGTYQKIKNHISVH